MEKKNEKNKTLNNKEETTITMGDDRKLRKKTERNGEMKNKNERDIKLLKTYKANRKLDRFKKIFEVITDVFRFVLIVVSLITVIVILYFIIKNGGIFI